MAFDVSKLTSAVNNYLYSISDVNKLLNGEDTSDSQTSLTGIFQKYFNKAISDEVNASGADSSTATDLTSVIASISKEGKVAADSAEYKDVASILASLSTGGTDTAIQNGDYDVASVLASLSTGGLTETNDNASDDSFLNVTLPDYSKTGKASTSASDNGSAPTGKSTAGAIIDTASMAQEIREKAAFPADRLTEEIQSAFKSRDIREEIAQSIASHDRMSELDKFNASRLKAYKTKVDTSAFGDFRL